MIGRGKLGRSNDSVARERPGLCHRRSRRAFQSGPLALAPSPCDDCSELRRERYGSRSCESARQLGEDRQVGDPANPPRTDALQCRGCLALFLLTLPPDATGRTLRVLGIGSVDMGSDDLSRAMERLSKGLRNSLETSGAIGHALTRGEVRESELIEALRPHLPMRYELAKGEVVARAERCERLTTSARRVRSGRAATVRPAPARSRIRRGAGTPCRLDGAGLVDGIVGISRPIPARARRSTRAIPRPERRGARRSRCPC
jgi:hypothetical protein